MAVSSGVENKIVNAVPKVHLPAASLSRLQHHAHPFKKSETLKMLQKDGIDKNFALLIQVFGSREDVEIFATEL